MTKFLLILLSGILISGCSFFHVHKMDIEQGNVLIPEEVNQIHRGMSESEVKKILGNPVLTNLFNENRVDYVYTFKAGNERMTETYVRIFFKNGTVADINSNIAPQR